MMEEIKVKEKRLFEVEALRENDSGNEDLWKEFLTLNYSIRSLKRKEAMNSYQKSRANGLDLVTATQNFFT